MVATVTVRVLYGAGPTASVDVNGLPVRLIAAASSDGRDQADVTNPLVIPGAGFGYTFYKHIALSVDGGTFTQIDNVQAWSDGTITWTLGTGGQLQVGTRDAGVHGCPDGSYDQAQGDGTYGYAIDVAVNGHPYYNGQTVGVQAATAFTTGAKMQVDDDVITTNVRARGVVFQVKCFTDATQGEKDDETWTYSYDEI